MSARAHSRKGEALDRLNRRFGILAAISTAVLGVGLGIWGDFFTAEKPTTRQCVVASIATGIGLVFLLLAGWAWFHGRTLLAQRGSAFLIDADAQRWQSDAQKRRFEKSIARKFAQVYFVPGPNALGTDWRWPAEGAGMRLWSGGVDDLVLALRAVQRTDDEDTPNNILGWIPWPAAITSMARFKSAEGGLSVFIRQRPIGGRQREAGASSVDPSVNLSLLDGFTQAPQDYQRTSNGWRTLAGVKEFVHPVRLVVTPGEGPTPSSVVPPPARVRVLLVRTSRQDWATLTAEGWKDGQAHLAVRDYAGLGIAGTHEVDIHEWRYVPPKKTRFHAWDTYPDIVAAAVDWICRAALPDGINLLGMIVPQEVSLGMGLDIVGSRRDAWPQCLWPLYKPDEDTPMTIPGVHVGRESLTRVPKEPRCS